jgi:ComF family protein
MGGECAACLSDPPHFDAARAALAYDDLSARLVLDMKRGGRRDGLPTFAAWMRAAGADILAEGDAFIPVPLHWTKLARRRFNQATWLAQAVAEPLGKPVLLDVLKRTKRRRSPEGLSRRQRRENVRSAFRAPSPEGAGALLRGKTLVLVDDVFTTGATLEACAKALRPAKPAKIYALTLARVVRPLDLSI